MVEHGRSHRENYEMPADQRLFDEVAQERADSLLDGLTFGEEQPRRPKKKKKRRGIDKGDKGNSLLPPPPGSGSNRFDRG